MDLRQRRREETRRSIQSHALRLFVERGYDATTVTDVARAAGVSPMTLYRHFPTKEDLLLSDQLDRLIADRVAAGAAEGSLVRRIGTALIEAAGIAVGSGDAAHAGASPDSGKEEVLTRVRLMFSAPAVRARNWDSQLATQKAIVDALRGDTPDPDLEFRSWVVAAACMAAVNVALMRWVEQDGRPELPALVADALSAAFGDEFP